MARPHKQGLAYFPHDTDACSDDKVQSLMALYGTDGYAFYFILLEKIFRTENGRITCGNLAIKAGIAKSIGITLERFEAILATALEIGCFAASIYTSEGVLTSSGVEKRILSVNTLRLKDRERKDKYKDKRKRKRKGKSGKPTENPQTPILKGISDDENLANFTTFYAAYPKKEAKSDALKAWTTLIPDKKLTAIILDAVNRRKNTEDWQKEKGKYIPLPATWLRKRRWEDELNTVTTGGTLGKHTGLSDKDYREGTENF